MMWKIIVLYTIMSIVTAHKYKATFNNYKVFRIIPKTETEVNYLRQLEEIVADFWLPPSVVGRNVDAMIAPHRLPEFVEAMDRMKMSYQVSIEDVQKLIDQTTRVGRPIRDISGLTSFSFTTYNNLETIYNDLDDLAKKFPNNVQVIIGGKTYEGRKIKGVKVSFKQNNPGIFLEGGIHAREWISPATVMYILHQLLSSNNKNVRELAERHDWYIFPVFNPDGYVYTHTEQRLWRKTRKPYFSCVGADLNRNWSYKWQNSFKPCSHHYSGSSPFSEIETLTMAEYIKSISGKFYAYISFHSFSQLLMYPYGYTADNLDNYKDLHAIGLKAVTAITNNKYHTEYRVGNVGRMIYICHGTSTDYIKGVYKKPIVYVYELRDRGEFGFLLPADQIIPTGEETLESLVVMFQQAKARKY